VTMKRAVIVVRLRKQDVNKRANGKAIKEA
jgi:uncharacterized protein (UPF0335 family)